MNTEELFAFTRDILLPKADEILRNSFEAYCNGADIGIQTKSDNTPATNADREAEMALRTLITENYPSHGIQGEEFGSLNPEADWIWVLDPLDGTREFLAKRPSYFGTLIGLLYKGEPCLGAISDPIKRKHWLSVKRKAPEKNEKLDKSIIACTNTEEMFKPADMRRGIFAVRKKALNIKTDLNCLGFAGIVDGDIDAAIENNLKAHDIIPLLPVLHRADIYTVNLSGIDYTTIKFDTEDAYSRKYGLVAAANPMLVKDILNTFHEEVNG